MLYGFHGIYVNGRESCGEDDWAFQWQGTFMIDRIVWDENNLFRVLSEYL